MKDKPQNSLESIALFWPLLLVPATLYLVKAYGNIAGTILLGVLFGWIIIYKADVRTRRLMIVLATISAIFETANVGAGLYAYAGTRGSLFWISLGWAIFGWWAIQLTPVLSKLNKKAAFGILGAALLLFPALNGTLSVSSAIAFAGVYFLSLASAIPVGVYVFSSLFGILAEYSGTALGVWNYFDLTKPIGNIIPVDLASLALSYSVVLAVCFWISGFENTGESKEKAKGGRKRT